MKRSTAVHCSLVVKFFHSSVVSNNISSLFSQSECLFVRPQVVSPLYILRQSCRTSALTRDTHSHIYRVSGRDCKGISWRGATELISSHFQWISVDGTSYQMTVSGCQWMAVDVSGCQWILASFIWDEVKVLLILLSIIYFRWMKMISFQYVCC